jgi:hypothetical protein
MNPAPLQERTGVEEGRDEILQLCSGDFLMNEVLVLHSVEDARHCVENGLQRGNMLFSTHSSVDVYLKESYGVECRCLSGFLTTEDVKRFEETSSDTVDRILRDLDLVVTPSINEQFGLKMRYFTPLYSYSGKHHFCGYTCFVFAVRKMIEFHSVRKISFYGRKFNDVFDSTTDMKYIAAVFFEGLEISFLGPSKESGKWNVFVKKNIDIIRKIFKRPRYALKKAVETVETVCLRRRLSRKRKTVLLYDDLYDLRFLKKRLHGYNVLHYGADREVPFGFKRHGLGYGAKVDLRDFDFIEGKEDPFIRVFLKDIREDFLANIGRYIGAVRSLEEINKEYSVLLGIWGSPPVHGVKSAIFEYLKSGKTKVIGAQHGSVYGDSLKPCHYDSDYSRCDHYFSYGFTGDDLKRGHPAMAEGSEILPVGKAVPVRANRAKKSVDILFPVANATSMFEGGMSRLAPHKLTERQTKLLKYLNSLEGLDIYVKPYSCSTYQNCSVLPVLKRMKNIKFISNLTVTEFLEKYQPKAVLIEFPSTPLFEVMHLDTEIFLMNNDINPFEEKALEELHRRVHYSEDVGEIIAKIDLFSKGQLGKKRDDTFYRHYVYKKDRDNNILGFIDLVMEQA